MAALASLKGDIVELNKRLQQTERERDLLEKKLAKAQVKNLERSVNFSVFYFKIKHRYRNFHKTNYSLTSKQSHNHCLGQEIELASDPEKSLLMCNPNPTFSPSKATTTLTLVVIFPLSLVSH